MKETQKLGQDGSLLLKLLGKNYVYNSKPLQAASTKIEDCALHVLCRAKLKDLKLADYQRLFSTRVIEEGTEDAMKADIANQQFDQLLQKALKPGANTRVLNALADHAGKHSKNGRLSMSRQRKYELFASGQLHGKGTTGAGTLTLPPRGGIKDAGGETDTGTDPGVHKALRAMRRGFHESTGERLTLHGEQSAKIKRMQRTMDKMLGRKPTREKLSVVGPLQDIYSSGTKKPTGTKAGIVIKQIVKQQQTKDKQRSKRVRGSKKHSITQARKRYTAVKKQVLKALRDGKKRAYGVENDKIKGLPIGSRKIARDKARKVLKQRLDKLISDIKPASHYKHVELIENAIQVIRKLKW